MNPNNFLLNWKLNWIIFDSFLLNQKLNWIIFNSFLLNQKLNWIIFEWNSIIDWIVKLYLPGLPTDLTWPPIDLPWSPMSFSTSLLFYLKISLLKRHQRCMQHCGYHRLPLDGAVIGTFEYCPVCSVWTTVVFWGNSLVKLIIANVFSMFSNGANKDPQPTRQ